jgi:hypothetical protein
MKWSLGVLLGSLVLFAGNGACAEPRTGTVTVDLSRKAVRTFRPDRDLGAGLDGTSTGEVALIYTPHNLRAMGAAGLRPITYRLKSELGIQAWHWNPEGAWSDPDHQQGYWTSSRTPGAPITLSHIYRLPRRGNSYDNAGNDGFSRLDDGDEQTFWKSNPYLDRHFTGMDESRPQWAIISLEAPEEVDTARIVWAEPYATAYEVQYWVGIDQYDPDGYWVAFPGGVVGDAKGGAQSLKLGRAPQKTQYIRLFLKQSSGTAPAGSRDIRDGLGYAIAEVYLGKTDEAGVFHDLIRHTTDHNTQTRFNVSSTDPWHRASDIDKDIEQPGVDLVFRSSITNGLPVMMPVGAIYDIPDNAAALIAYIKARGYPLRQVELGEEADGQLMSGTDYADLYLQAADAIKAVDPKLKLGGPSLQNGINPSWMDNNPKRSFTGQFVDRLTARGRMTDFDFFSFERYAFDDMCAPMSELLRRQSKELSETLGQIRRDKVPETIPWVISEYGFSPYSGRAESELPSALLNADVVGQFLSEGGQAAYLFGYGPNYPVNQHNPCAGFGNMMLHQADENGQAKWPMPAFWGAQLMTTQWALPGHGLHRVYPARASLRDDKDRPWVTAYAVYRPDKTWAVMIVNRSDTTAYNIRLKLKGTRARLRGPLKVWQYSPAQYQWHDDGENSRPSRNLPPVRKTLKRADAGLSLPAFSLTIVRGSGPKPRF